MRGKRRIMLEKCGKEHNLKVSLYKHQISSTIHYTQQGVSWLLHNKCFTTPNKVLAISDDMNSTPS